MNLADVQEARSWSDVRDVYHRGDLRQRMLLASNVHSAVLAGMPVEVWLDDDALFPHFLRNQAFAPSDAQRGVETLSERAAGNGLYGEDPEWVSARIASLEAVGADIRPALQSLWVSARTRGKADRSSRQRAALILTGLAAWSAETTEELTELYKLTRNAAKAPLREIVLHPAASIQLLRAIAEEGGLGSVDVLALRREAIEDTEVIRRRFLESKSPTAYAQLAHHSNDREEVRTLFRMLVDYHPGNARQFLDIASDRVVSSLRPSDLVPLVRGSTRAWALEVMERMPATREDLLDLLREEDSEVRMLAVRLAGRQGIPVDDAQKPRTSPVQRR